MNPPASVIRVVIADDHVLVRQGIRAFLETHADLTIVGEGHPQASVTALDSNHAMMGIEVLRELDDHTLVDGEPRRERGDRTTEPLVRDAVRGERVEDVSSVATGVRGVRVLASPREVLVR